MRTQLHPILTVAAAVLLSHFSLPAVDTLLAEDSFVALHETTFVSTNDASPLSCDCATICDCGSSLGEPYRVDPNTCDRLDIGGWVNAGYTSASTGMFNNIPHRVNFNQAWLYAERVADGSYGLDWGFRADIMYGIDSADTQAFGNNIGAWDFINGWDRGGTYGWAMPQAYAEIGYGNLSVIGGHFYTIAGYERVQAPKNFFYSHSLTQYNSEPFTHTGVLAKYARSETTTLYLGWTLGWDTGFDQFLQGNNVIAGMSFALSDNAQLTYVGLAGNMGVRGDGYTHSLVLDVELSDRWNYVFQSDYVNLSTPFFAGANNELGINQYLFYTVNEKVSLGARMEWWKSDAGFNHGGQSLPGFGSHSYYEATFGLNYRPCANVVLRPEYRQDWFPGSLGGGYSKGIFAIDVVATF